MASEVIFTFQSTPSSRKATLCTRQDRSGNDISIHTFLAEGDRVRDLQVSSTMYFNPHLPRGRRPLFSGFQILSQAFQSTPSSRKATSHTVMAGSCIIFQSTPSSRKATSITTTRNIKMIFQSTPSSRKATSSR